MNSVSLGIFSGAGSRYESEKEQGVSHFLEHLMFKGTTRRSAKDIAETVDDVGGQLNAATDRENTCYYIKLLPEHLDLGMDILSDMLLNSKFAVEDIEKERQVVLEEISLYEDSPDELVHDLHLHSLWPGHALGRNILGTRESIAAMDRQTILAYRDHHYTPDNLVIAAAGNLQHEKLEKLAARYWGNVQGASTDIVNAKPVFCPARLLQGKEIEQLHICLGTPGFAMDSEYYYAAHVFNTVLGGGVSSRLFQSIREERGLAYSICSFPTSFRDTGLFTIYAGVSPENAAEVLLLTQSILEDIRSQGVQASEIKRAKEQLKSGLLFSMESSSSRMSRIGRTEISCREYLSAEKLTQKIEAVSSEQLFALTAALFQKETTCFTVLGPVETARLENFG